jgi:RHH-type proline utilization regulon transcriptional repressor/proline dehydrogenase/delta 1-pyrroline-5-carboxylate dehydrogenase
VLRARDFEHALELANGTPYGLTAGLHSLDERQQARYLAQMACGNLYVNRSITGAIVGRQPFGGHKASSVGPGAKAGGPNYVLQLVELADADESAPSSASDAVLASSLGLRGLAGFARQKLSAAELLRFHGRVQSYAEWLREHFRRDHPAAEVMGQDNLLRYLPCGSLLVLATGDSGWLDLASVLAAALLAGNTLRLGLCNDAPSTRALDADFERDFAALGLACGAQTAIQPTRQLATRLEGVDRIRWLGRGSEPPPEVVLRAAAELGCHVSVRPVLGHGRYELLFNHREQAISIDYHRYGHLGWRSEGLDSEQRSGAVIAGSKRDARAGAAL